MHAHCAEDILTEVQYYGPDYELAVRASNMDNANSKQYLERTTASLIESLRNTAHAPSVQSTEVPRVALDGRAEEDDDILDDMDVDDNPDVRMTQRQHDQKITRDDELYESDDESHAAAIGVLRQNGVPKNRNITDLPKAEPVASDFETDSGAALPRAPIDELFKVLAADANAEVQAEVMEAKTMGLATAMVAGETGPSNAPSRSHSQGAFDNDGDVSMEDSVPVTGPSILSEMLATNAAEPLSPADSIPSTPAKSVVAPAGVVVPKIEEADVPQTL